MQKLLEKQPITQNLKKLIVGESFSFAINRVRTIRQTIQNLKLEHDLRFTTATDMESKTIKVTRIK